MAQGKICERDLERFRRTNIGQPLTEIAKDFARCVMAGQAADAAAWMSGRATLVEPPQRAAIIGIVRCRPFEKHLIGGDLAVKDVAMG